MAWKCRPHAMHSQLHAFLCVFHWVGKIAKILVTGWAMAATGWAIAHLVNMLAEAMQADHSAGPNKARAGNGTRLGKTWIRVVAIQRRVEQHFARHRCKNILSSTCFSLAPLL